MVSRIDEGRHAAVDYYRSQGMTLHAIARKMDVSRGRISQMIANHKRVRQAEAKKLKHCSAFLLTLSETEWTYALQEPR